MDPEADEYGIEHRKGAAGIPWAYVGRSRIRVSNIARMYQFMLDEIVCARIQEQYPTLTLEQVQKAVEYWRAHEDEIEKELSLEDEAFTKIVNP